MMSQELLSQIEKRCAAARPGPWMSWIEGRNHEAGSDFIQAGNGSDRSDYIELVGATKADQDFIAAARTDIPMLLEEIRRLRAQIELG